VTDPDRPAEAAPRTWLVDGFNLLHAAVLRGRERSEWWRGPARERVVELARSFDDPESEVVVVFDGEDEAERAAPAHPSVVFAQSADDWILAAVRRAPDPRRVVVVTADLPLADRARHRGARVMGPREFAARCRATASADLDPSE
jgi:predicted RNA-binding protein with PIN domain